MRKVKHSSAEEERTVKLEIQYCLLLTSSVRSRCLCVTAGIFQNEDSWSEPHCWRALHVCVCVCVNTTSQQKHRGLGAGGCQTKPAPLNSPCFGEMNIFQVPRGQSLCTRAPLPQLRLCSHYYTSDLLPNVGLSSDSSTQCCKIMAWTTWVHSVCNGRFRYISDD